MAADQVASCMRVAMITAAAKAARLAILKVNVAPRAFQL
jgi:hypothetical protein